MLLQVWHPDRFVQLSHLKAQAEHNTKLLNSAYDHFRSHLDLTTSVSDHLYTFCPEESQPPKVPYSTSIPTDSKKAISELIVPFELGRNNSCQQSTVS